jgi:hypothetical protein
MWSYTNSFNMPVLPVSGRLSMLTRPAVNNSPSGGAGFFVSFVAMLLNSLDCLLASKYLVHIILMGKCRRMIVFCRVFVVGLIALKFHRTLVAMSSNTVFAVKLDTVVAQDWFVHPVKAGVGNML